MVRKLARRLAVGAIALAAVGLLAACEGEALEDITPAIGVNQITVEDNRFEPRVVQITKGTEVTWTWEGDANHDVVGDDFSAPVQREGTFSYTFETPGFYKYVCRLHSGMTGAITVTE